MRVLATGFTDNIGGVESFIMNYYRNFTESSIVVDLLGYTDHPAFAQEIRDKGGKIYTIPSPGHRDSYAKLCQFMEEHAKDYAVIWCNKCELYNIDYLKAAKKYGIPKRIIHSHNSSNMYSGLRKIMVGTLHHINKKKIERYATDFWTCSDFAAKWLFPAKLLEEKDIVFIPNAIDSKQFRFEEEIRNVHREKLGASDQIVIGSVGRLTYQKNPGFMLEVFNEIYKMNKNTVLWIVGRGDLEEKMKEKASHLSCANAVKFLGVRMDVPQLMQAMDCMLLPSRFEGLPVVAVEAQATGLPVVAAKDGITPQTKLIKSFAFLSLHDSPEKWAYTTLELCTSQRENTNSTIKQKGFDITVAAKDVQNRLLEK